MNVLVTGANGFIGKNLMVFLAEMPGVKPLPYTREQSLDELEVLIKKSDCICHLAGVNRPQSDEEFESANLGLTETITDLASGSSQKTPILFTSSIQAEQDNLYGKSKLAAEKALRDYADASGSPVYIFRLPNVFGKWCKPDYNSVVATFCHNIANELPIKINDSKTELSLVYIDDVLQAFAAIITGTGSEKKSCELNPVYKISLGDLADTLYKFRQSRESLITERVGAGLTRALYATYLSYLKPEHFAYELASHEDERGAFVELLKTRDSGQFSYFTAKPGITRGSHYHHTKTEKFVVVQGQATFRFRHLDSGQTHSHTVNADKPEVVETIPGWAHDITNTGESELVVFLWANEIFDPENPDTIAARLDG